MQAKPIFAAIAAAAACIATAAHGATFQNQLHTGSASGQPSPGPVTWENLTTAATGTFNTDGGHASLNWNIGIINPDQIRLQASGFAGSLGGSVNFTNVMTVTLTEPADFSLIGTTSTGLNGGNRSTRIAGPGIFGVPTQPDGSLLLAGNLGGVSLFGTLLPGEYTITMTGSGFGGGTSASFSTNLILTVPAPAAAAPLLAALALTARRRRAL